MSAFMTSKLLTLPLELRHEIYSQLSSLHAADLKRRIGDEPVHHRELPYWLDPPFNINFSLCCRQIYHEYRDHLFRQSTLKSITRFFSNEIRPLVLQAPVGLRLHITRCEMLLLWKPAVNGLVHRQLDVVEAQITEWRRRLPSLRSLDMDLRYYDLHDLEIDILEKAFKVNDFLQLQGKVSGVLQGGRARLQLSAITSFCSKNLRSGLGLGYEEGSLDKVLTGETYVCWKLESCRREDAALSWYGLMPEPCRFYCYGLEAKSMLDLREVVSDALEDDD